VQVVPLLAGIKPLQRIGSLVIDGSSDLLPEAFTEPDSRGYDCAPLLESLCVREVSSRGIVAAVQVVA